MQWCIRSQIQKSVISHKYYQLPSAVLYLYLPDGVNICHIWAVCNLYCHVLWMSKGKGAGRRGRDYASIQAVEDILFQ